MLLLLLQIFALVQRVSGGINAGVCTAGNPGAATDVTLVATTEGNLKDAIQCARDYTNVAYKVEVRNDILLTKPVLNVPAITYPVALYVGAGAELTLTGSKGDGSRAVLQREFTASFFRIVDVVEATLVLEDLVLLAGAVDSQSQVSRRVFEKRCSRCFGAYRRPFSLRSTHV